MARKIRLQGVSADGPATSYYNGKRVEMQPGETFGAAYRRQYGQQPADVAQSTPASEVNLRRQVGQLVEAVGAGKASQYIAGGYSPTEALEAEFRAQTAEKDRLAKAVATKQATDQERARQDAIGVELKKTRESMDELREAIDGGAQLATKRKGFAGKLRFGSSFKPFGAKHPQRTE